MPLSVQEYLSKRQDKAAGSSSFPGKPPERISDQEMQSLSSTEANTGPALDSPFAMNQMVSHGEQRVKDPGFFSKLASGAGNLAKEAYKGVARPLFTPVAGLISGITGEDVELPEWAGSAKGSVDLDKQARIAGGAALETAALLPAGKAVQALKGAKGGSSLLKLSLAEAKLGAKSGFASAAGSTLGTNENATAADVVGSGIAGGLVGGAVGGVAPAISRGWSKVRGSFADDAEKAFQAGKPKPTDVLPGEMPKVEGPKSLHEFDEDLFPIQSAEAKVLPEKVKKRALDLGFKEHQVNNIEQASNAERAMIKEMADIAEAKSKNVLYPKDPTEVAARPIIDQVKHLKEMRSRSGKSLDELVAQMPDKPIPITEQRDALQGWFESNGVKVDPEGNLDFSKSKYRSSASAGDRAILQELADEFKPTTLDNFAPGQIHKTPEEIRVLRQALREVQESKAKSGQPLSSSIETLIGSLRQELNAPLAKLSPAYEAANKNYAVTSDALTKFYKFLGKRFYDSEDELANMRVQELLGRLVSNVPANTKAVLDDVAQAAGKTGMQIDPNVDVRRLLHADEMISDIYGLAAPRGFQGGIERGVKNAAEGLGTATDIAAAAAGSPGGLVQRGLSFFGKITPEKRKAALLEMLGNAEVPKVEAAATAKTASSLGGVARKSYPGLNDNGKAIEQAAFEKIDRDLPSIIEQHKAIPDTMGGKLINPDDFRPLVHDQEKFGLYDGTMAETVHEPVSEVANKLKSQRIAETKPGDRVIWTAGGPGNGKGSAIKTVAGKELEDMAWGYDSVLGSPEKSAKDIQAVLDKGGFNHIPYVWRQPEAGWLEGVIGRAKSKGRTLPLDVYLDGMEKAWKNIMNLHTKFGENQNVKFDFINNEIKGGDPFLATIEDVKALDFSNLKEKYEKILRDKTEKMFKDGEISQKIRDGLLGKD